MDDFAQANGARLVTVSRIAVAVWAIIMGCAMCIAQVAQINVNWLVLLIGVPLTYVLNMRHLLPEGVKTLNCSSSDGKSVDLCRPVWASCTVQSLSSNDEAHGGRIIDITLQSAASWVDLLDMRYV